MSKLVKTIMVIFFLFVYFYTHELTHQRVFEIYECEEIEWGAGKIGFYVSAICDEEGTKLVRAITEIIGYGVVLPIYFILIVLVLR